MSSVITPRELRFIAALVAAFLLFAFVACGHSSSGKQGGKAPSGAAAAGSLPTATPVATEPPTSMLPGPPPGPAVAVAGRDDAVYTISPATYADGDGCASLGHDVATGSAPDGCASEWATIGTGDIPGADLMNSMGMPHTVSAGPGVSEKQAVDAATAFYRWQAFETWAENNTNINAMEALDPPEHADPVVAALTDVGARVTAVPQCNLPVALRVVRLDATATSYIAGQGWNVAGPLAVLATYPACAGITITHKDNTTSVVAPSDGETAINPGELATLAPFGQVWKIEGEAMCGGAAALQTVCSGGS